MEKGKNRKIGKLSRLENIICIFSLCKNINLV